MSENIARALDQVKVGLRTLYSLEYLTKEEWIEIDGLIHKETHLSTYRVQSNSHEKLANGEKSEEEAEIRELKPLMTSAQQLDTMMSRSHRTISRNSFDTSDFESSNAAEWNDEADDSSQLGHPITNQDERKPTTCRFWAKNNSCKYTRESCKYLHEHTSESAARNFNNYRRGDRKYDQQYKETWKEQRSGKLVNALKVLNLPKVEIPTTIEDCEYLASYNLVDHSTRPKILVPGSPRLWSPLLSTKRLNEDLGEYCRDLNATKYPSYPTEPSFRALLAMQPNFDLSTLDIVGCGSTLGNLLRFCEGISADFRFDIDRVRDTVFLIRKENSRTALIRDVRGYGHSFADTHTVWEPEVNGSVSHQRIIRYTFGGLNFLVRTESDGYIREALNPDTQHDHAVTSNTLPEFHQILAKAHNKSEDDICALLEAIEVSNKSPSLEKSISVEMKGQQIPQKAIFDLKTRARGTYRPIDMNEVYRRLWVNQTPYFIFAQHVGGCFEPRNMQPISISNDVLQWEKDHGELLKNYQAILMGIIAASKSSLNGKLQVIRCGNGPLEIRERAAGDVDEVLPSNLRKKWWS